MAERLILSLGDEYFSELSAAWDAEIDRRIGDINNGRVALIEGEQAIEMIRQRNKP